MIYNLFLILILLFIVLLSGIFAGSETGMYQLSILRLRLNIQRKKFSYILLSKIMKDRNDLLLSMLVGTNLTHYIITSIVTILFLRSVASEHTAKIFTTLVTAPVLFVFAELLPKSIFFHRAGYLMPFFGPLLYLFHKVFSLSGIVALLRFFSKGFAHLVGITIPSKNLINTSQRPHIKAIFKETEEEGFLSDVQRDIFDRLAKIPDVKISSIMTTMNKVETVDKNCDKAALFNKLKDCNYTRLPVHDRLHTNIVGWINIYEALESPEDFTDISSFIKPIRKLKSETDIISAIKIMQQEKLRILLVIKTARSGKETPLGIVTMKDLAEEFLGELAEW
ncbi:MAG: CNNM domain-containing protein [Planctomycetota bacterium]|jgi:CBS domain containing-hemolysin-like protein